MSRIFLTLVVLQYAGFTYALARGLSLGDPTVSDPVVQATVSHHMLAGLFALMVAILCHAILLTYFMGTGRWLEETTQTYRLSAAWRQENIKLKWQMLLGMTLCLLLLIATGAFGAAADPASMVNFTGWGGLSAGSIHLIVVLSTISINLLVNAWEYFAVCRNSELIQAVLSQVHEIRVQKGLEV